ncbi:hypothetical protein F5Y17DRAFT_29369 [Xylariaceae sp. FL0594]|nr:hypothetical protein F5Y17DRAFT_29369 [Xylariaceae sp. FL0594]
MLVLQHIFSLALFLPFNCFATAKTITDLFDISFTESVGGSCYAEGQARFDRLVTEALALAEAGIAFAQAALDSSDALHMEAQRLGRAWFRTDDGVASHDEADIYDTIQIYYEDVRNWLMNGGPVDDGRNPKKPYLFCEDDWAIRKSLSDPLYDANGNTVKDNNGDVVLIRDSPDMMNGKSIAEGRIGEAAYPYWSQRVGGYVWQRKYGDLPTQGQCHQNQAHGQTFTSSGDPNVPGPASWIVLCGDSFTDIILGQPTCKVVDLSQLNDENEFDAANSGKILDIIPESGTFFHELFHLVKGSEETRPMNVPDSRYAEIYSISQNLGDEVLTGSPLEPPEDRVYINSEHAQSNPETYTNVAIAFYYTKNKPLPDGRRQEFFSGDCTVGALP